jgi:hypothetical protein
MPKSFQPSEPVELPCAPKIAFDTAKQAKAAATVAAWQHGAELQIYRCQYCALWHLSSVY